MESYRRARVFHRLVRRTAATRPMAKLYAVIQQPLDRVVYRLSSATTTASSWLAGVEITMLTTTGAKTGRARTLPVLGLPDGRDVIVIASNFGRRANPAWYYNLRANPRATIVVDGVRREVVGRELAGSERARGYRRGEEVFPGFTHYPCWAEPRQIPVLRLEPLPGATARANRSGRRAVAYDELKERQSAMWGSAPYQRVAATSADIHDLVVERLHPRPGERWLDLASGTGAVAERAAARGAEVIGVDLAPALIETARERAAERGLDIDYRVGDCERLELPDASFDTVSSTFGVMFTPDHPAAARELARVTRAGGRIALANWTPTGGVARMFRMMAPFQPETPPSNPFDWGDTQRVRALLGEWFELELEEHVSTFRVPSGEAYWELLSTSYGPTKTLADSLGERREELHRAWVEFFESNYRADDGIAHTREYLLMLGERR